MIATAQKKPLGQLLVSSGVLKQEQLDRALEERLRLVLVERPLPAQNRGRYRCGGIAVAHAPEAQSGDAKTCVAEASEFHDGSTMNVRSAGLAADYVNVG